MCWLNFVLRHPGMSADEVAPRDEHLTTMAPQVPDLVYAQLKDKFGPASKHVSETGIQFLKTYKAFEKANRAYCEALHSLIKSADGALIRTKHEADDLSEIFAEYLKVVKNIPKAITEFENYLTRVTLYASMEKDNVKSDFKKYKSEKKNLLSQKSKSKATDAQVQEFYHSSAATWAKQQQNRYTFFKEKIRQQMLLYIEIMKELDVSKFETAASPVVPVEVTPAVVEPAPAVVEPAPAVEKPAPAVEKPAPAPIGEGVGVVTEHVVVAPMASESVPKIVEPKLEDPKIVSEVGLKNRSDSDSTNPSTLESPPEDYEKEESTDVILIGAHNRSSISITPVAAERRQTMTAPAVNTTYHPVPSPRSPSPPPPMQYIPHAHSNIVHVNGKTLPGAKPIFGGYVPPPPPPPQFTNHIGYNKQDNQPYRVIPSNQIQVGRVVSKNNNSSLLEEFNQKRFPVNSSYNPAAAPSHHVKPAAIKNPHEVVVRTAFSPSQYGSILIVNDDFNASSGEQITVNRGDKVVLIKCGVRGWSFVRDAFTGRTGWIPSPYLEE